MTVVATISDNGDIAERTERKVTVTVTDVALDIGGKVSDGVGVTGEITALVVPERTTTAIATYTSEPGVVWSLAGV